MLEHWRKTLLWTALLGLMMMPASLSRAEELELLMQEISFVTDDNVTIVGSWVVPQASEPSSSKRAAKRPAVILLHDLGLNRRDWGVLIPDLVRHGYNVLAFDLRGHGQTEKGGSPSPAYLMSVGPSDVKAALKWIKSEKTSDKKKIMLIGVGLGADIAFQSAGILKKQIYAAVVISPTYTSVFEGNFIKSEPRRILFCASAKYRNGMAMITAESLSNFTRDPKKLVVYNSAVQGFTLFYKHPEIKQEILNWIGR